MLRTWRATLLPCSDMTVCHLNATPPSPKPKIDLVAKDDVVISTGRWESIPLPEDSICSLLCRQQEKREQWRRRAGKLLFLTPYQLGAPYRSRVLLSQAITGAVLFTQARHSISLPHRLPLLAVSATVADTRAGRRRWADLQQQIEVSCVLKKTHSWPRDWGNDLTPGGSKGRIMSVFIWKWSTQFQQVAHRWGGPQLLLLRSPPLCLSAFRHEACVLHNGAGVKGAAGDSPRAQGCSQLRRNTEAAEAGWTVLMSFIPMSYSRSYRPGSAVGNLSWPPREQTQTSSLWLSASLEVMPRSSPLLDRKWCLSLCWCETRRTFLHWGDRCSITNIITPAGFAACSLWWRTSPDQAQPLFYTLSIVDIAVGSSASGLPPPASHRQHRPACSAEEF